MAKTLLIILILAPFLTNAEGPKLGLVDSLCFDYSVYKNAMVPSTNSPGGLSFKSKDLGSYNIIRDGLYKLADNRSEALNLAYDLKIPNYYSNAYDIIWAQRVSLYENEKPLLEFSGIEFGNKPKIQSNYKIQVNPVIPLRARNFGEINSNIKTALQTRSFSREDFQDFLDRAVQKCKQMPTYKACVQHNFEDSVVTDLAVKTQIAGIISEAKSFYLSYSNSVNTLAVKGTQDFSEWIKRDILRGRIGGFVPSSVKTVFRAPLNILKTEFAGALIYFFANTLTTSGENASSLSYINGGFMSHSEARRSFNGEIEHLQFFLNESNYNLSNRQVCDNLRNQFAKNPPKTIYRKADCATYRYEKVPLYTLRCEMDNLISLGNKNLPDLNKIDITDYETDSTQ